MLITNFPNWVFTAKEHCIIPEMPRLDKNDNNSNNKSNQLLGAPYL